MNVSELTRGLASVSVMTVVAAVMLVLVIVATLLAAWHGGGDR